MQPEDVEKMVRPALRPIKPYEPVEPPGVLSRKLGINEKDLVKLDANENPYGCSPRVREALKKYPYLNLYPDPEHRILREALEKYTGFSKENIIAGSGSDELIELILRLFLEPGDKVINCTPTFGMYSFCTATCAGQVTVVPRHEDFSIDMSSIRDSIDEKTRVIFLASPNNPSGNMADTADVLDLLQSNIVVVVDEAYFEFSGITCAEYVLKYPNLIVLRTFSKWAGLAGLRVGYGIFPANLIKYLMKIKQPYNVNIAAQVAAIESLNDLDYLKKSVKAIIRERGRLLPLLKKYDWLNVYDSASNFILCKVRKGEATDIYSKLREQGIIIRYYNTPELKNYIRISVGKPGQTAKLIKAMDRLNPK
jgi:histidinol-phosphate aminotransferase